MEAIPIGAARGHEGSRNGSIRDHLMDNGLIIVCK
jgi:hypothetical protein